jgi:hypothetical protein
VPRIKTLDAFCQAFATLGYAACSDEALEPGFEKIALIADDLRVPKHAARQLPTGRWTASWKISSDTVSGRGGRQLPLHLGQNFCHARDRRSFIRQLNFHGFPRFLAEKPNPSAYHRLKETPRKHTFFGD